MSIPAGVKLATKACRLATKVTILAPSWYNVPSLTMQIKSPESSIRDNPIERLKRVIRRAYRFPFSILCSDRQQLCPPESERRFRASRPGVRRQGSFPRHPPWAYVSGPLQSAYPISLQRWQSSMITRTNLCKCSNVKLCRGLRLQMLMHLSGHPNLSDVALKRFRLILKWTAHWVNSECPVYGKLTHSQPFEWSSYSHALQFAGPRAFPWSTSTMPHAVKSKPFSTLEFF